MSLALCPKLIQFCAIRVSRLQANGVLDPGAGNLYASSDQISMGITMNTEAGDDFTQKTGCGNICYSYKVRDQVKNLALTLSMCDHDPEFVELLQGGTLLTDGADVIGYKLPPVGSVGNENGVGVEGWVKNIDGSSIDSTYPYIRFVFPRTYWTPADKTLENNPIPSNFTGEGVSNNGFYDGPVNDIDPDFTSDTLMSYFGDTALPTTQCYAIAMAAS